jgi:hypothetical protein
VLRILQDSRAESATAAADQEATLRIVRSQLEYLFDRFAAEDLQTEWRKLVDRYGPRLVFESVKRALAAGLG